MEWTSDIVELGDNLIGIRCRWWWGGKGEGWLLGAVEIDEVVGTGDEAELVCAERELAGIDILRSAVSKIVNPAEFGRREEREGRWGEEHHSCVSKFVWGKDGIKMGLDIDGWTLEKLVDSRGIKVVTELLSCDGNEKAISLALKSINGVGEVVDCAPIETVGSIRRFVV